MRNLQKGNPESTDILADLVPRLSYKPGWSFGLQELERGQGCEGLTLLISFSAPDSCNPDGPPVGGVHLFPVLPANYNREAWEDWILECVHLVERHETHEFFRVDGKQVYFPSHGPGRSPYVTFRVRSEADAFAEAQPWNAGPVTDPHFQ